MEQELSMLSEKVAGFIANPEEAAGESRFNELALEVFDCQYRLIAPYRRLCQSRDRSPANVRHWREIPAVPADALKHFFLFAGKAEEVARTFKSSGTTQAGRQSQAHFSETGLQLMNASVEANARARLFPERQKIRILALTPSPEQAPELIMVHGMSRMLRKFGDAESRFCFGMSRLDLPALFDELKRSVETGAPVALLGSSFGFVHLFDAMEEQGLKFRLPAGSRLMDAGGYKGRSREIERSAFVQWAMSMLGLPSDRVINLLGMTELASQIYDQVGAQSQSSANGRAKAPPHWVRSLLVDPAKSRDGELAEAEAGRPGLLRHFDLANVERPIAIQSEDIAVAHGNGYEVLRRTKGAEPRGCSLSLEEFNGRQA
ncbi:MAG TPA: long-chain fatty acid--CoA ligase [bacterium]|nr:long-chain fatty acid--CoA ligase [bacterium]